MASSRRQFLRTAAGTIGVSWGGMRILAGQTTAPSAEKAGQLPRLTQPFIYGSAFYRPPNPPASMRREMLKTFAQEYKFNIIRIYSPWAYHNREPERFNFEELEEVMGYCDEFGTSGFAGRDHGGRALVARGGPSRNALCGCERPAPKIDGQLEQYQRGLARTVPRLGTRAPSRRKIHRRTGESGGEASVDVRL